MRNRSEQRLESCRKESVLEPEFFENHEPEP